MKRAMRLTLIFAAGLAAGTLALAEGEHGLDFSSPPESGSVAPEDGLAA